MIDWEQLRAAIAKGPAAVQALLRPELDRMLLRSRPWRVWRALLQNDRDDIVQEALWAATSDGVGSDDPLRRLRAALDSLDERHAEYLLQAIVNGKAFNQLRKNLRRSQELTTGALDSAASRPQSQPDPILDQRFRACLEQLNEGPRESNCSTLVRHLAFGRRIADIAFLVGRPEDHSVLRTRTQYCRSKLKHCLDRKGVDVDDFLT